jgi:pyrimidine/purine-5'-nucleotide nucleosidase
MTRSDRVSTSFSPMGSLNLLSRSEVERLLDVSNSGLHRLFRNCALAVLNCGGETDNSKELLAEFHDFDINVVRQERGIRIELINAPESAFVDGVLIQGIKEHLVAVVRDLLYSSELPPCIPGQTTTDLVFSRLRHAQVLTDVPKPNLVVCWGGHSIPRAEYEYCKEVGYEMGLRGLDVCTGCGPGAMKGPMKGAAVSSGKQRRSNARYLGISEPGIIAAEPPNPMVNGLVIMPDIEKRLEAFVRMAHGIIVFPGGVGTMEEILYILGILSHPENQRIPLPLIFTGPESCRGYFKQLDAFLKKTLGHDACAYYRIIVDDAETVARHMASCMEQVTEFRRDTHDAFSFNWKLFIDTPFQEPFVPTHQNMAMLQLDPARPMAELACDLRRAFSGIVAGNVKEEGIRAIEENGPYVLHGDPTLMVAMDELLTTFARDGRMKLAGAAYEPCYRIESSR